MAKPNSTASNLPESDTVKLPPLRSLEPMANPADTTPHRDQSATYSATAAVSDERTASAPDKQGVDSPARTAFRQSQPPATNPSTQTGYGSPSPPPPAPAALSSLAGQPVPYEPHADQRVNRSNEAAHPSHTAYNAARSAATVPATPAPPGITAWSSGIHGSLEPNTVYSLERIHAASLALYNYASEHLERQIPTATEELYGLLPIVSEVNQELRSLLAVHEGRPPRDSAEMAPYYPWASGNGAGAPYWIPGGRDEREGKIMRTDDGEIDDKTGHLRRRSPGQNKTERMAPRGMRVVAGNDDLGSYAPGIPGQPIRTEPVYLHQPTYPSHNIGKATSSESANTGQYVPKYRKRSRAPAPGVCHACGNSDTPEWRRGPDGARTLCNACGLHFSKLVRRRTLEYANAAPGTPIPPVTTAELRASTAVGSHSNVNVTAATDDPTGGLRGRSSSMYSNPAAAAPSRSLPVDPVVDVNSASAGVPPAPHPPPLADLERAHEEVKRDESTDGSSKRTAPDMDLSQSSKQPRTG